jgi:hypothetical protein
MKQAHILFALLLTLTMGFSTGTSAKSSLIPKSEAKPIESTTAFQLLELEFSVRKKLLNKDVTRELLRSAIDDATVSAQSFPTPRTRQDALPILEAIQVALVKHNFIQPLDQKDWPDTLAAALTPHNFSSDEQQRQLSYQRNVKRVRYLDLSKPLYFVDCDMGAQFFLAVAQRLGWDMRLVEVPQHNFVRWHLSETLKINWDWTRWESNTDEVYLAEIPTSTDPRLKALYVQSWNPRDARAYYEGLIGSKADEPEDGERLLQEAVRVIPNHPTTLNNYAWLLATRPALSGKSRLAVAYGLAAWSMDIDDGNVADTVACAFAADKRPLIGERIEQFAIDHASSQSQRDSFE